MKGMGTMHRTGTIHGDGSLRELKEEIEEKRNRLNNLIIESIDSNELLKFSVELDELIEKYYKLELNKRVMDI